MLIYVHATQRKDSALKRKKMPKKLPTSPSKFKILSFEIRPRLKSPRCLTAFRIRFVPPFPKNTILNVSIYFHRQTIIVTAPISSVFTPKQKKKLQSKLNSAPTPTKPSAWSTSRKFSVPTFFQLRFPSKLGECGQI